MGDKVKEYLFLFFWQFLGIISTLTALSVVKQISTMFPFLVA